MSAFAVSTALLAAAGPRRSARLQRRRLRATCAIVSAGAGGHANLEDVDKLLKDLVRSKTDTLWDVEDTVIGQVRALRERGVLRGFGAAACVPKRNFSLAELRLNKIEPVALLSPADKTLDRIRTVAFAALMAGIFSVGAYLHLPIEDYVEIGLAGLLIKIVDQVANAGGAEALVLDSVGRLLSAQYGERVVKHEAGHFLIAYLMGVLPKAYTLSSVEALTQYGAMNVQAGCTFCEVDFQREISTGKITAESLERFACIALAGVAQEYITFGSAEGGMTDIRQLDGMLRGLGFTQKKADSEVRWAVLNTVILLRRHAEAHAALVEAMGRRESVGRCIEVIERHLEGQQLRPVGAARGAGGEGAVAGDQLGVAAAADEIL